MQFWTINLLSLRAFFYIKSFWKIIKFHIVNKFMTILMHLFCNKSIFQVKKVRNLKVDIQIWKFDNISWTNIAKSLLLWDSARSKHYDSWPWMCCKQSYLSIGLDFLVFRNVVWNLHMKKSLLTRCLSSLTHFPWLFVLRLFHNWVCHSRFTAAWRRRVFRTPFLSFLEKK